MTEMETGSKTRSANWSALKAVLMGLICLVSVTSANTPGSEDYKVAATVSTRLIEQVDKLNYEGKYLIAIPLAEKAVAIRERIFGKEHIETASVLDTLGYTYRQIGRYKEAQDAIERALRIFESSLGTGHPETARSLNNLGALFHLKEQYDKALPLYEQALKIRVSLLGPDNEESITSMMNLGKLYIAMSDYKKSAELLEIAVGRPQPVTLTDRTITVVLLGTLGDYYCGLGDLTHCREKRREVLQLAEALFPNDHPQLAEAYCSMGNYYYSSHSYEKAAPLFEKAIAIFTQSLGSNHPQVAKCLDALALLFSRTGAYARAVPLLHRSLDIRLHTAGRESLSVAKSLNNLAEIHALTGKPKTARMLLGESLRIKQKASTTPTLSLAVTLHNLGISHLTEGDFQTAEAYFNQALSIRKEFLGEHHPLVAETLAAKAIQHWRQQAYEKAARLMREANTAQAPHTALTLQSTPEVLRADFLKGLSDNTYRYVSFSVENDTPSASDIGFRAVVEQKGRILDAVASDIAILRTNFQIEDLKLFDERARTSAELSTLTYNPIQAESEASRAHIRALSAKLDELDSTLANRSSSFIRGTKELDVESLRIHIPSDTALVEWFRYVPFDPITLSVNGKQLASISSPRFVAYIVRRDRETHVVDLGDANELEADIYRFRDSLLKPEHVNRNAPSPLYRFLVAPLERHLIGVKHLLISPDGALNLIPFSAITDERGARLQERYEISYLTSSRDLSRTSTLGRSNSGAIVLANPLFGDFQPTAIWRSKPEHFLRSMDFERSGFIFRPLDYSEQEAQELGKVLGKSSSVLTGAKATEAAIKKVRAPSILHIASHGFFLSDQEFNTEVRKSSGRIEDLTALENPLLRSGLALAGANKRQSGENEDGILTALEVAQLDLNGTELVVLSACDTGLGEVRNGEGVYGLRRALVLAGAQTQVTSLWKVSDEATRILMVSFYKKLLAGEGRSEALRHAQLELMDNPKYSHPYYWASFIPIGDWTPLRSIQKNQPIAKAH